YTSLHSLRLA
ncbi:trkA-C domain protein, partial [Vibrio parahaemolyticus V-223/04]